MKFLKEINIPDVFRIPHFNINTQGMTGLEYNNSW